MRAQLLFAMPCFLLTACSSYAQRPVVTDVQPLTNGTIAVRRCTLYATSFISTEVGVKECKVEIVKPVKPE